MSKEVDLAWLRDAEDSERAGQLNGEIVELSVSTSANGYYPEAFRSTTVRLPQGWSSELARRPEARTAASRPPTTRPASTCDTSGHRPLWEQPEQFPT
jgi:hypothetical protein